MQLITSVMEVKLCDCALRGTRGPEKGQLLTELSRNVCWLEFSVTLRYACVGRQHTLTRCCTLDGACLEQC